MEEHVVHVAKGRNPCSPNADVHLPGSRPSSGRWGLAGSLTRRRDAQMETYGSDKDLVPSNMA